MKKKKVSALFISDVHLGSKVSRGELVVRLLNEYESDEIFFAGDLFDDLNLHRLHKEHWELLTEIRSYSKNHRVILVMGNHDQLLSSLGKLLGIDVVPEIIWTSKGRRYLIIHGHQFDRYVMNRPITTAVASAIYYVAQHYSWNEKQQFARFLKKKSKQYLRLSEEIAPRLAAYAKSKGADGVIFGHTHESMDKMVDGVHMINCGCFTDVPSSCVIALYDGTFVHHEIS